MAIIKEILEIKRNIENNKKMTEYYRDANTAYDLEKYQKEFFYYMQNVYPFRNSVNNFALDNGITVQINNIETVPNYPRKQNWTLCNFVMSFYENGTLLMSTTIEPDLSCMELGKDFLENSINITGINYIKITRNIDDEKLFLLAVEAFKYVMNNPDEILKRMQEIAEAEYRYIINYSYYDNLDEIQKIHDLGIMVEQYMNNPSTYTPFESVKVDRPDFSKMGLNELIAEFNKKGNSDDVEKACTDLGNIIMGYIPGLNKKSTEITEFYKVISDNESYISDTYSLNLDRNATVENNGFTYYFKTYSSSSQMLINLLKNDEKIGSLYYWNNNRKKEVSLYFYIQQMGAGKMDFRGFNKKTLPAFMQAVLNLDENWNEIVTPVLTDFMKDFEFVLDDYRKQSEEMLKEKDKVMEDFYKRQENFEKYF